MSQFRPLKSVPPLFQVYIIEANPRASRTVPFVAKAVGHPLATYASLLMAGQTLKDLNFTEEPTLNHVAVKEAVLPFEKFQGAPLTSSLAPGPKITWGNSWVCLSEAVQSWSCTTLCCIAFVMSSFQVRCDSCSMKLASPCYNGSPALAYSSLWGCISKHCGDSC